MNKKHYHFPPTIYIQITSASVKECKNLQKVYIFVQSFQV